MSAPDQSALFPKDLSINMPVNVITTVKDIKTKQPGVIKFIGHTSFSPGIWIGVALNVSAGKNDGSVNGKRYFECAPEHGIFVKEDLVERIGNVTGGGGRDNSSGRGSGNSLNSSGVTSPKNDSDKKSLITGLLKVKLSQMMSLLNDQLAIVIELEKEDRNKNSSSNATALQLQIVDITNQERNLLDTFQQQIQEYINA